MIEVIQETGYEGNTYGDFLVLNFHQKSGQYYTRINIGGTFKIARMSLSGIMNNVLPREFPSKLFGNPYLHLVDGTTILFDIHGYEIYIDTDDFIKVSKYTWSTTPSNDNYVAGNIKGTDGKQYKRYLHQVIMGTEFKDRCVQIDHIDLNVLNNKKCNLRICNNRINNLNKHIHNSDSKDLLGIYKVNEGIYKAVIKVNGNNVHIGTGTLEQAKCIRKLVSDYLYEHDDISSMQLALFKKQVGILDTSADDNVYRNNELGLKYIRLDKRSGLYQVRINFKDGKGTVYCGSRKNVEDAIELRDKILNNNIGGN